MILIHRVTPFLIGLAAAVGFAAAMWLPTAPLVFAPLALAFAAAALLYGRLNGWQVKTMEFWHLAGMPLVLLLTGMALFLFVETAAARTAVALTVAVVLLFYTENLFSFLHLPARYQAYSIEHLSLVMNLLSAFALAAAAFGMQVFLQAPLWLLSPVVALVAFFLIHGTLWTSKAPADQARRFAVAGSLLYTEVFIALSFLPTGFYTNAAIAALFFYVFLGITRAHFVNKLSRGLAKRYAVIAGLLTFSVLATTQWV